MNQTELVTHLTSLSGAVGQIGEEITALQGEVQSLKDALASAGNTTPEVDAALAAVEARVSQVAGMAPIPAAPAAGPAVPA